MSIIIDYLKDGILYLYAPIIVELICIEKCDKCLIIFQILLFDIILQYVPFDYNYFFKCIQNESNGSLFL